MKQNCKTTKLHPAFISRFKQEAAKNNMSMVGFGASLAWDDEVWQYIYKKKNRGEFNLKF